MADTEETEKKPKSHPLAFTINDRMSRSVYKDVVAEWEKASDRTIDDPDGAITSARSLLEGVCKIVLDELKINYGPNDDLPKLYHLATHAIGIAPGHTTEPIFQKVFGASQTLMKFVAEIRNKYGDAHGKSMGTLKPSQAQAELAVNIAASVACFLASQLESHLTATKRRTQKGKVILKFDKTLVWRLYDHAMNAPKSAMYYGKRMGKCLMLVGDSGIYLISNGRPAISWRGIVPKKGEKVEIPLLVAHAEGCGPTDELDDWWPLHNLIDGGSDFAIPVMLEELKDALRFAKEKIVIVADNEGYFIMTDSEFEQQWVEE